MSHAEWIAYQCRRLGHPTAVTTWVRGWHTRCVCGSVVRHEH